MQSHPLIVIGGGAAGMIAAWRAAALGVRVLLLEKNPRLGIKIRISGGGKCNVTHAGDMEKMRTAFRTAEARFLRPAFHAFTNADIRTLLNERGVKTYERENGKVFPVDHKAGAVVHALRRMLEDQGVTIRLSTPVKGLVRNGRSVAVIAEDGTMNPSALIVACGGLSYAKTGTTGDGYRWLEALGLRIVPPRPALAPMIVEPKPPLEWAGVAIRDCRFSAVAGRKERASWNGDLLFTHTGISGPAALEVSRGAYEAMEEGRAVTLVVDFLPHMTADQLETALTNDLRDNGSKQVLTIVEKFLPARLAPALADQAGVDRSKRCNQIDRRERTSLRDALKGWSLGTSASIELDRGEVTAGGVALDEVNPRTMESKKIPGLFVCGEILDVSGPVGGYNLQAAFSTGYVAGEGAARYLAAS